LEYRPCKVHRALTTQSPIQGHGRRKNTQRVREISILLIPQIVSLLPNHHLRRRTKAYWLLLRLNQTIQFEIINLVSSWSDGGRTTQREGKNPFHLNFSYNQSRQRSNRHFKRRMRNFRYGDLQYFLPVVCLVIHLFVFSRWLGYFLLCFLLPFG
jgi:hypothetical protein